MMFNPPYFQSCFLLLSCIFLQSVFGSSDGSEYLKTKYDYKKETQFVYNVAKEVSETGEAKQQLYNLGNNGIGRGFGYMGKYRPSWISDGDISVSFREEEDNKMVADYAVLAVIPIIDQSNQIIFSQFRLGSYEPYVNDQRTIVNSGIGYRKLSNSLNRLWGVNAFFDYELNHAHMRLGPGFEYKQGLLDINVNYYQAISDAKNMTLEGSLIEEKAVNGYDIEASYPFPYLAWTRAYLKQSQYDLSSDALNTLGYGIGMQLASFFRIEVNQRSTKSNRNNNFKYTFSIQYPPQTTQPTLFGRKGKFIADSPFGKRDLRKEMKKKVRRNNNIVVKRSSVKGISFGGF